MIAIGVIAAPTQEEAEYLHASVRLLQRRIRQGDRRPVEHPTAALDELKLFGAEAGEEGEWRRYVVGTPARVREELEGIARALQIDELVVNTITWDHEARLRSYDLLAQVMDLAPTGDTVSHVSTTPVASTLQAGSRTDSAA